MSLLSDMPGIIDIVGPERKRERFARPDLRRVGFKMKDLKRYATAPATDTMEAFADFLIAEVFGGTLPKGVNVEAFRKGVALGGSLRMDFQKSDFWKNHPDNYLNNVEANREAKAKEQADKAKAALVKAQDRVKAAEAKANAAIAAAKAKADALAAKAEVQAA